MKIVRRWPANFPPHETAAIALVSVRRARPRRQRIDHLAKARARTRGTARQVIEHRRLATIHPECDRTRLDVMQPSIDTLHYQPCERDPVIERGPRLLPGRSAGDEVDVVRSVRLWPDERRDLGRRKAEMAVDVAAQRGLHVSVRMVAVLADQRRREPLDQRRCRRARPGSLSANLVGQILVAGGAEHRFSQLGQVIMVHVDLAEQDALGSEPRDLSLQPLAARAVPALPAVSPGIVQIQPVGPELPHEFTRLAGINMQHGLNAHRGELIKTLEADDGRVELRAVTGPDYGRIWDHELVAAVMKIAGDGIGDTRWKVPGLLDWSTMTHNPFVEVTSDTTTLYASDRGVFLSLVDDAHPIEAGRLPNGDPDL